MRIPLKLLSPCSIQQPAGLTSLIQIFPLPPEHLFSINQKPAPHTCLSLHVYSFAVRISSSKTTFLSLTSTSLGPPFPNLTSTTLFSSPLLPLPCNSGPGLLRISTLLPSFVNPIPFGLITFFPHFTPFPSPPSPFKNSITLSLCFCNSSIEGGDEVEVVRKGESRYIK